MYGMPKNRPLYCLEQGAENVAIGPRSESPQIYFLDICTWDNRSSRGKILDHAVYEGKAVRNFYEELKQRIDEELKQAIEKARINSPSRSNCSRNDTYLYWDPSEYLSGDTALPSLGMEHYGEGSGIYRK